MMEEIQEQRFVCKFCNKRCLSGKSLGGHMRGHLALISAAKKGKQKALSNIGFEGGDHSGCAIKEELPKKIDKETEQSNSPLNQEKLKNNDMELDSGEDSYGLREHPRKSWKISDLQHADSSKRNHCKECGKGFPSVRALAGHMRCHPLTKREKFPCKKCNKGFDSMRALFGHMKCHSKRSRISDEPAESIAEFATLCPVKKKRSTIRYRPSPNLSFSSQNTSSSSFVTETEEVEDVAWCLMMLSRGVTNWDAYNSISLSSNNNDSVTLEADSFDHYMGISKNEAEDFVNGETCKMENQRQKLVSGNAFSEEVITSAIGVFDSAYANGDENFKWELSPDAFLSSDKFKKLKVDKCEMRLVDVDSTEVGLLKALIPEVQIDNADLDLVNFHSCKNLRYNLDPRFWWESSEEISYVATDLEIQEAEKTPEYKCKTCGKIFGSHKALGGHQNKHKIGTTSSTLSSTERTLQSDFESNFKLDSPDSCDDPFEAETTERINTGFESVKSHQCPICFKIFSSGQALGGHKRAHYAGLNTENKTRENLKTNQEVSGIEMDLGLGLAVSADGGASDNVDSKLWWTATSHEHEALMMSN